MEHLDVETAHRLLRGDLDPAIGQRWLEHADRCQRCHDLLANERAMMAVLQLGEADGPTVASPDEQLLERLAAATPGGRRQQRHAALVTVVALLLCVVLGWSLKWQVDDLTGAPEQIAAGLGIDPALQSRVVTNLSALRTLSAEPWLARDYETVLMLEELILETPP